MADFHNVLDSEDFQEDQIWDLMNTKSEVLSNSKTGKTNVSSSESDCRRFTSTPRTIPRTNSGGVSPRKLSANHHSSAPVKINQDLSKNLWDADDVISDDDEEMVPPHEYLARRFAASTHIASYSMCEGIGRTLKGRDLSTLRNAILSKTGFLE
ncbi:hypothetical protein ACJIZ3_006613 [Penstemon smallii]|uniref:Senescence regulator n=1 Tax=Penstemon smallii TaxID=265156 RepID=A0ABD3S8Q1_9LAMI